MAAVPTTFVCMVYPRDKSTDPYPATLVGFQFLTGLSVGGGPMPPGTPPELPPIDPPPPEKPLDQLLTAVAKEPPPQGGWGFFPEYGWVWSAGPSTPGPKR